MTIAKLSSQLLGLSLACGAGGILGLAVSSYIPGLSVSSYIPVRCPPIKRVPDVMVVLQRNGDFIVASERSPGQEFWYLTGLDKYQLGDKLVLGKDIEFTNMLDERYLEELRGLI